MVTGNKKLGKKPTPRTTNTKYNCDEVETYLDKAVEKIKNEILPKIEAVDARDKTQYESSREYLTKTFEEIVARNTRVETTVSNIGKELDEVYASRTKMVDQMEGLFDTFHRMLTAHIAEENVEFKTIKETQEQMKSTIETVQDTLNNVSANGNKGLHASLKDLYNKNNDVHQEIVGLKGDIKSFRELVQPELDRKAWWVSTKKMMKTSSLFKMIRTKVGFMAFVVVLWFVVNVILHTSFGINLGLESLVKILGYGSH